MKKFKRIFALAGVILLCALYASTLLFAFIDRSQYLDLLKASIAATIILPVFLYAAMLFHRLSKKDDDHDQEEK